MTIFEADPFSGWVDLQCRFDAGRGLAGGLEQVLEVGAHVAFTGDQARPRVGEAVDDADGLDALAERGLDAFDQELEGVFGFVIESP